jgi:Uma2 family endonuclease
MSPVTSPAERFRHRRAPNPIVFPVEETVPESLRHLKIRTALFAVLERELRGRASTGSDQFVYWNARDPRRCLAPDVFVRLGTENNTFATWKCWLEGGPPHLAIEVVSEANTAALKWEQKLERYHELGVMELVWFDADEQPGARLRVWDRLEDDLVERVVENDTTPCATVGLQFVVAPLGEWPVALRLARPNGELMLTADELLADAERARADAERRVAELEAELARRK